MAMVRLPAVEEALHRLYIGASGAGLRKEDRKKAAEIASLLSEIGRLGSGGTRARTFRLVDAAAGKAYVGLLAAELVLAPKGRSGHVTVIERDAGRAEACRRALAVVRSPGVAFEVRVAEVADPAAWPDMPDVVVALHACGSASDAVIEQTVAHRARHLLLVPCCTSGAVPAAQLAVRRAQSLGLPRHAEVRRRFLQAVVDAERTLRLEAAGYATEIVSFVPPTVTPHHLLWRARRVGEPIRMAEATRNLQRLRVG